MQYEVELKFPLVDGDSVRLELEALGAEKRGSHREVDSYLRHPSRSFQSTNEALRVRESQGQLRVTYKGPKIDATTKTRLEIELELAPGSSSYAQLIEFWRLLGFEPVRQVTKVREEYVVNWLGRSVSVCWDHVTGLGDFIELEISSGPALLEESRQILNSLADHLGLHHSERRSYLELLLENDPATADEPEK